jgi:hypothetical protein
MCLSLFLQCSRFYIRGKRHQKHHNANEHSALICLQLKAVQIHLAASLQEQQSAQRAMEQEQREKEQEMAALGLGFVPALGLGPANFPSIAENWESTPAEPLPGLSRGGDDPAGISGQAPVVDIEPMPGDDGQVAEEAKELRDELPATGPQAASMPPGPLDGAEGPTPAENGTTAPEGGVDAAATKNVITTHPLAGALLSTMQPPAPPAPIALGPAGDIFVVVNLEVKEVEVFAEYHHDFVVAFQVTSAYCHQYGESVFKAWPRALYRQVVLLGNFGYLKHLLLHVPLTKEYLEVTVQLYLNEVCPEQFPVRAQRMRQFLRDGVPNLEVRYQLARALGPDFADISMETASLMYMA